MSIRIPDVSEWNSKADIAGMLRQSGGAIIIRLSFGAGHKDALFDQFRSEAHTAGAEFVGVYQYIVASQDIPEQVHSFRNWAGDLVPGEIPIGDIEEGAGDQSARINSWLSQINQAYKLPRSSLAWMYSYLSFVQEHNLSGVAADNPFWLADYSAVEPSMPHTLWQCTDGINGSGKFNWAGAGYCDTSIYHGTIPRLAALAYQNTSTPKPAANKEEDLIILRYTDDTKPDKPVTTYLYGNGFHHITSPKDEAAFAAAGLPVIDVTRNQLIEIGGSSVQV